MLGDPVLWQAFYQAKDGLISALREAPLVYQAPSGLRVWKDTGSILASITEAVHEIETVQSELSSLRSYLIRSHAIITNRHTLPGMLPIELLQEIISLVVPYPYHHQITLKLSQVSKRFRDAVLGISRLFTKPDWTNWPVPLLELWCQRARTNPLTIYVYDFVLHSVGEARKRALLESCSSQWGYLHISMRSPREKNEIITTGISSLLRCSAPSLHTLVLIDHRPYDSTGAQFALDCAPSFRRLDLYNIWPLLPASHTSVTDLSCECLTSRDWLRCQDIVRSCRLLQRLMLGFGDFGPNVDMVDMTTEPNMQTTLTSVVHLELRHVRGGNVATINQFLAHFDMPNLNSLRLVSLPDLNLEMHGDLYESLVRSVFPIYLVVSRRLHRGIDFLASVSFR